MQLTSYLHLHLPTKFVGINISNFCKDLTYDLLIHLEMSCSIGKCSCFEGRGLIEGLQNFALEFMKAWQANK